MALVVQVGYSDEAPNEIGISHFIEHLGLRGTIHFPNGIRDCLQRLGLELGRDFNATTGDKTYYQIAIPSNDSVILKTSLLALRDQAGGQRFLDNDVREEKAVVLNELTRGNSEWFSTMYETRYQLLGQNAENKNVKESEIDNIQRVTNRQIQKFYRRWYRPRRQMLVVVGDVNVSVLKKQIERIFGDLKDFNQLGEPNRKDKISRLSGMDHRYIVTKDPNSRDIAVSIYRTKIAELNIKYPSTVSELKAKVQDDLFNCLVKNRFEILAQRFELPFHDISTIVERRAIVESAGIDAIETRFHASGVEDVEWALRFIGDEMRRIVRWGFSDSEMERAKRLVIHQRLSDLRTSSALLASIRTYRMNGSFLPVNTSHGYEELAKQVSSDDVIDTFRDWLTSGANVDMHISTPPGITKPLPTKAEAFTWLEGTENESILPLTNVKFMMLPNPLANREAPDYSIKPSFEPNTTELVLANGAKVLLKCLGPPRKTKEGDGVDVALHCFRAIGASSYGVADYQSARAAAAIQSNMGVSTLNSVEYMQWKRLNNEAGLILGASPYVTNDESGIKGGASLSNVESLLNLVYLLFSQPRKDSLAFNAWLRDRERTDLREQNHILRFEDSIAHTIGIEDNGFTREQLNQINYERSYRIYRELFSEPGEYTFILAGYFDQKRMAEISNHYLGAIVGGDVPRPQRTHLLPKDSASVLGHLSPLKNLRATIMGDSIGNVHVRILFRCTRKEDAAATVKIQVLNEIIKSLLFNRLRERERGVYSVLSNLRTSLKMDEAIFDINFEASPNNVDALVASAIDEIQRIARNDYEEHIFYNAISTVNSRINVQMNDPFYWTEYLSRCCRKACNFDIGLELKKLQLLSRSDLNKFTKNYVKVEEYSLFMLL
ncbi:insulinase family protein [Fulvivirgaceae bacterium PWU37]|uniref:Insulinase family protein n=2 Tax=Dawidia soli TaxID=2782352 RepID=A0AAP2DCI7_9BACT|nr:insulinase family protein [Dawidia soli]